MALVWGLLLFVGFQGALSLALESRPDLRDPEYGCHAAPLRRLLAQKPGRPLVLAAGSSRLLFGLRPADLPPDLTSDGEQPIVFNYGLVGGGPLVELVVLRRLLAEGIRPRWAFLEWWPPTMMSEGGFPAQPERMNWDDLGLVCRYSQRPGQVQKQWAKLRLLPWFADRGRLLDQWAPRLRPPQPQNYQGVDDAGWMACPWGEPPFDREQALRIVHNEYGPTLEQFAHCERADRAFRELLTLCRRERVKAVLVYMPEARVFQGWYGAKAQAVIASEPGQLSRDFDVPLIDARDWVPDEQFSDGLHLRRDGTRTFTLRFGDEVLRPLLTGKQSPPPTFAASR
jgi:hypothetical protein